MSGFAPITPPPTGSPAPYTVYDSNTDIQALFYVPSAGGSGVQVTTPAAQVYNFGPDMAPDALKIAFIQNASFTQDHLRIVDTDGANNIQLDGTDQCSNPNYSPANDLIIYRIGATSFFTIAPDGTGKTDVTPSVGSTPTATNLMIHPTFNRDGTLVAFQVSRTSGNPEELWVMNADGSSPVKVATLINTVLTGVGLSWAHAADQIAYTKGTNQKDVRVVNADGSGDHSISDGAVAAGAVEVSLSKYAWAPDDSAVYVVRKDSTPTWTLWMIPADGSGDAQLTDPSETAQIKGQGYPYLFGDRVYTIDNFSNLVSVTLAGGGETQHDGDSGSSLFPDLQDAI